MTTDGTIISQHTPSTPLADTNPNEKTVEPPVPGVQPSTMCS